MTITRQFLRQVISTLKLNLRHRQYQVDDELVIGRVVFEGVCESDL